MLQYNKRQRMTKPKTNLWCVLLPRSLCSIAMLGRGTLGFVLGVLATIALVAVVRLPTQEVQGGIAEDERWPMAKLQKLARHKMLASVVSSLTKSYRTERSALSRLT